MRKSALATLVLSALLALVACAPSQPVQKRTVDRKTLAETNLELGLQYMQGREYQTAMDKLKKAIELDPRMVEAHNAMALLHATLGQNDQAEASFKRALGLDGESAAVLNNYGQFLCQRKRYDEGQKLFVKAAGNPLYKNPEMVFFNAGSCAMNAGKLDVAEDFFRKSLELDGRLAPTLLQMADLNLQLGRHLQARGYLQRYVELADHSPKSLWLGIQIERALGDRNAESSYALLLEKNFPDSPQTKLLLDSKLQ